MSNLVIGCKNTGKMRWDFCRLNTNNKRNCQFTKYLLTLFSLYNVNSCELIRSQITQTNNMCVCKRYPIVTKLHDNIFYVFILFEHIMQKCFCSLYSNRNSPVACSTTFSNAMRYRGELRFIISTRRGPWVIYILYNIMLCEMVISKKPLKAIPH